MAPRFGMRTTMHYSEFIIYDSPPKHKTQKIRAVGAERGRFAAKWEAARRKTAPPARKSAPPARKSAPSARKSAPPAAAGEKKTGKSIEMNGVLP